MKQFNRSMNLNLIVTALVGFGSFDVNSLLNVELQTDSFDIERTLIPEGDVMYKTGKPKLTGGEKDSKAWARLTLPLQCVDPQVLADLGVEKIGARYETFLDLDENNMLAQGPNLNVNLGKLFDACGLRSGGEMAALSQLEGRTVIGATKIKRAESGVDYNEVSAVVAPE